MDRMPEDVRPHEDGDRKVDYSDPAREPHQGARHPTRAADTSSFVIAGIITALVIVGGFIYAGYLSSETVKASISRSATQPSAAAVATDPISTGSVDAQTD